MLTLPYPQGTESSQALKETEQNGQSSPEVGTESLSIPAEKLEVAPALAEQVLLCIFGGFALSKDVCLGQGGKPLLFAKKLYRHKL